MGDVGPAPATGLRHPSTATARPVFPWIVFALSFALLLSDFMCRQVLAAVFPYLKVEWALSDTQLAALSSVVALTVGVLTVPLSLLADRFGRRRAVVWMAAVWSLATLGSALAADYGQLLAARALVGVGEAAYASVGLAIVLRVFPAHRRASLAGAFTAGPSFGAVLGVALGGSLAVRFGWRWSVAVMAVLGVALLGLYRWLVTEERLARHQQGEPETDAPPDAGGRRAPLSAVLSPRAVICAYIGNGLQLFVAGALLAWLPSFLDRNYALPPDAAARLAGVLILIMGVGMIGCGILTDRLARAAPLRTWTSALAYAASSLVLLGVGFSLPPGRAQLALLGAGALFTAGTTGPAGALVVRMTAASIRASALGMLALASNLLGLSAGPLAAGLLADRLGLADALRLVPSMSLAVIAVLAIGRRTDPGRLRRSDAGVADHPASPASGGALPVPEIPAPRPAADAAPIADRPSGELSSARVLRSTETAPETGSGWMTGPRSARSRARSRRVVILGGRGVNGQPRAEVRSATGVVDAGDALRIRAGGVQSGEWPS